MSGTETTTQPITPERLADIEAAVNAEGFTEGPWTPLYEGCDCGGDYGCGHGEYVWAIHTPVPRRQSVEHAQRTGEPVGDYAYQRSELAEFTSADLEFITEARTAVPELLAEVKRLRAQSVTDEDAENAASCAQDARIRELEQENDLLRGALADRSVA